MARLDARTPYEIARIIETKRHEHDRTDDPQRRAVLLGELSDLMRDLRRAARRKAEKGEPTK